MSKYLRIISIPHGTNINEQFKVIIRIKKFIEIEYIDFLYCKKNDWFNTTRIHLEKRYEDEEYNYFLGTIKFTEDEFYSHYCYFQFKVKRLEGEWVIKRNPVTNEPTTSRDRQKGYHWEIYVTKRLGKTPKKKFVTIRFYQNQDKEIICQCMRNKTKLNSKRIKQEIEDILIRSQQKNFSISYDPNMEFCQKELIRNAFYEGRRYLQIEGIYSIEESMWKK